jgi:hypothetical protein
VTHLPAAVSLLFLEALFMQISGVSLSLSWPCRLCLLRVLLGTMPLLQAFPFPNTLGEVTLHPCSQACMFIYSSCGKWVFPPLLWSFPPTATFTSFPTPDYWVCAATPAFFSQLVMRVLRMLCPLFYVSFFLLLLFIQFLFFPWVGVGLSRGLC